MAKQINYFEEKKYYSNLQKTITKLILLEYL